MSQIQQLQEEEDELFLQLRLREDEVMDQIFDEIDEEQALGDDPIAPVIDRAAAAEEPEIWDAEQILREVNHPYADHVPHVDREYGGGAIAIDDPAQYSHQFMQNGHRLLRPNRLLEQVSSSVDLVDVINREGPYGRVFEEVERQAIRTAIRRQIATLGLDTNDFLNIAVRTWSDEELEYRYISVPFERLQPAGEARDAQIEGMVTALMVIIAEDTNETRARRNLGDDVEVIVKAVRGSQALTDFYARHRQGQFPPIMNARQRHITHQQHYRNILQNNALGVRHIPGFNPILQAEALEYLGLSYSESLSSTCPSLKRLLTAKKSVMSLTTSTKHCFAESLILLMFKAVKSEESLRVDRMATSDDAVNKYLEVMDSVIARVKGVKRPPNFYKISEGLMRGRGSPLLAALAECLHSTAGLVSGMPVRVPSAGAEGPDDVKAFSSLLGVEIRVWDLVTKKCLYNRYVPPKDASACEIESTTFLNVLRDGNHFHPIMSVKGFLGLNYGCNPCNKYFSVKASHTVCVLNCKICRTPGCNGSRTADEKKTFINWSKCDSCNRLFPTEECLVNHYAPRVQKSGKETFSVCQTWRKCGKVGCSNYNPMLFPPDHVHECGDSICYNCKEVVRRSSEHLCFVMKADPKAHLTDITFFDVETSQEADAEGKMKHVITHVVVQRGLVKGEESCEQIVFDDRMSDGRSVEDVFCEWVFTDSSNAKVTFIAHNGQGYDFQFLLKFALLNGIIPKSIIRTGQKIRYMVINNVRFIDSLSFLTTSLSNLPAMFGLSELKKGFFPHWFNTSANKDYVGAYPDTAFYMPKHMSVSREAEFIVWHKKKIEDGEIFDFRKEILEYCVSDVDILRRACMTLRNKSIDELGIDPFSYITIAGYCLAVYRHKFMPERTIAVLKREEIDFIRRAFFGGRTAVLKALASSGKVEDDPTDYTIGYYDVCSMYPHANATGTYPKGHPTFEYVSEFEQTSQTVESNHAKVKSIYGYVECDVTCPTDLLYPVLPERDKGRLLFTLTPKVKAVYSTQELTIAIDKGYSITRIYTLLTWNETTTELFKGYVYHFLKGKQEASGWKDKLLNGEPVETIEQQDEWIRRYHAEEGVLLERLKVCTNPALRAIVKLCLNNLWGKFAERENMPATRYVGDTQRDVLVKMLNEVVVKDMFEVGPTLEVVYVKDDDDVVVNPMRNVAVAACTTALARCKIYRAMDSVHSMHVKELESNPKDQTAILYMDTDSLVVKHPTGKSPLPLGDKLGDWVNELPRGDSIKLYVGVAPKTYAYVTEKGKVCVKAKGFKIDSGSGQNVLNIQNFIKAVRDLAELDFEATADPVVRAVGKTLKECFPGVSFGESNLLADSVTVSHKICRDKYTKELESKAFTKRFRSTLTNKGYMGEGTAVLPFGYEGSKRICIRK